MVNRLKFFCVMLGLVGMTLGTQAAKTADCVNSNIVTIIQSDDEIIEIEGEEGYFDEFEDIAEDDVVVKKNTNFKDVLSKIILGILILAFLYAFFWLRHHDVTPDSHPNIYVILKVSKFSSIVGFIGCITFMICYWGFHMSNLYLGLIIGGLGLIIVLYAVWKAYRNYSNFNDTSSKVIVTILSVLVGLGIGYTFLYLGLAVVAFYLLWYIIKDALGWDKVVLSDGTEIRRVGSFGYWYKDKDGRMYHREGDSYVRKDPDVVDTMLMP